METLRYSRAELKDCFHTLEKISSLRATSLWVISAAWYGLIIGGSNGFQPDDRATTDSGRDQKNLPGISRRLLARHRQKKGLSRSVRAQTFGTGLARGADPWRIRRHGARHYRSQHHSRGDQPLRRSGHGLPRANVHHGHASTPRQRRAEKALFT